MLLGRGAGPLLNYCLLLFNSNIKRGLGYSLDDGSPALSTHTSHQVEMEMFIKAFMYKYHWSRMVGCKGGCLFCVLACVSLVEKSPSLTC